MTRITIEYSIKIEVSFDMSIINSNILLITHTFDSIYCIVENENERIKINTSVIAISMNKELTKKELYSEVDIKKYASKK